MRRQGADQVAEHRLLLAGDADAGRRRVAGDEEAERRAVALPGATGAVCLRLRQHRRPAAGQDRLRHEQRRQRQLEGERERGVGEPRLAGRAAGLRSGRNRACASGRRR